MLEVFHIHVTLKSLKQFGKTTFKTTFQDISFKIITHYFQDGVYFVHNLLGQFQFKQ